MRSLLLSLFTCVFAIALSVARVAAQEGGARIIVLDATTGLGVAGAQVELSSGETLVTDARGAVRVAALSGTEQILVRHAGYRASSLEMDGNQAGQIEVRLVPRPLAMDQLVVTALRRPTRLAETAVTTEVIPRRTLEESGASSLASVLLEQTGIQLQPGVASGEGALLQGLGSERVLVLIDGRPMAGRIGGLTDLSRVPTSIVERIEIVKGPQSTLYGSDAMGGVINVVTREAAPRFWNAEANVTAGSRGRMDAAASALAGTARITSLAQVGRRSIEVAPGVASAGGALARHWDGVLELGWMVDTATSIKASGLLIDERQRWRTGQLYSFADNRQLGARLDGEVNVGPVRLRPTAYLSRFEHEAKRGTSEQAPDAGEDETQQLTEVELLASSAIGGLQLDGGVLLRRERIDSDRVQGAIREGDRVATFVQAEWSRNGLSVVPGIRRTWSEAWGEHWAPRLALMFRPTSTLALRISIARGYRAPDFKELYLEFLNAGPGFAYVVRGNAALEPETSRNVTASMEWATERAMLRVQGFHNRFRSFIESRFVGDSAGITVYTYGNIEDGTTAGLEVDAAATLGLLRLEGGYGYLDAVTSEGEPLLGRPAHSARVGAGWSAPTGTRITTSLIYTGSTPIERNDEGTVDRAAYTRFDVRLAHTLGRGIDVVIGADNAFDAHPDAWPAFTGRHLYAAVHWRAAGSIQ